MFLCMASMLLWIYSSDRVGLAFWRWIFPGMVIGTIGADITFTGIKYVQLYFNITSLQQQTLFLPQ